MTLLLTARQLADAWLRSTCTSCFAPAPGGLAGPAGRFTPNTLARGAAGR
jgi:hypothetical protein